MFQAEKAVKVAATSSVALSLSASMHHHAPVSTEQAEDRLPRALVAGISLVAVAAVLVVTYALPGRSGREAEVGILPSVNATLNATSSALLVMGYFFVRRRRLGAHKACMLVALGTSAAFFVGYLIHHARVGSVPYQGTGMARTLYFSVLIPHVLLATAVLPLALTTVYRALTGSFERHRRIARWTLPIWLFVSVSGVVVYFLLYHG